MQLHISKWQWLRKGNKEDKIKIAYAIIYAEEKIKIIDFK